MERLKCWLWITPRDKVYKMEKIVHIYGEEKQGTETDGPVINFSVN